jgi:cyclic pyranopterin monophosphate synthase
MKDVSLKPDTLRSAVAVASLYAPAHCLERLKSGDTEKGDALKTARVAGILAAKRTDELIPLCHPLPIHRADVEFVISADHVQAIAQVHTIAPTGVEMEALTAASIAALTIYDMLKPYCEPDELRLADVHLQHKKGGASQYHRTLPRPLSASVIVLSDSVASGAKPDTAGRGVEQSLRDADFEPIRYQVLADESPELLHAVREEIAAKTALIITVGGTGLGPRDITIQTLKPLIDTEIPGIMEAARSFGQRRTPYAMLSRAVAGFAGESLLLTFPGSRRGAQETLAAILPGVIHLFEAYRGVPHVGGYAA